MILYNNIIIILLYYSAYPVLAIVQRYIRGRDNMLKVGGLNVHEVGVISCELDNSTAQ